jgi:hypothetical protein
MCWLDESSMSAIRKGDGSWRCSWCCSRRCCCRWWRCVPCLSTCLWI